MKPTDLPKRSAIAGIRLYQLTLSPLLGRQCRFYPSCSHYAREALELHGFVRGTWMTITRLGRCHPFHPGGVDPVPARATTIRTVSDKQQDKQDATVSAAASIAPDSRES